MANKKACLFGCLALLVVAGIAIAMLVGGGVLLYSKVAAYLDTEPMELPPAAALAPTQEQDLNERMSAFNKAAESPAQGATLELTGDEINALLAKAGAGTPFAQSLRVGIEGDRLNMQLSLPVMGRYFNGEATCTLGMVGGQPKVGIESVRVKDQSVPEAMFPQLEQALTEAMMEDAEIQEVLGRVQNLAVRDGKVVVTLQGSE